MKARIVPSGDDDEGFCNMKFLLPKPPSRLQMGVWVAVLHMSLKIFDFPFVHSFVPSLEPPKLQDKDLLY